MFSANFNVGNFQFKLQALDAVLSGNRIVDELRTPVEQIYKNAVYNSVGKISNNNNQWKPRKPQFRGGRRIDNHRLLQKTGYMRGTTKASSQTDLITISTQADYAKYHITGTKKMTARPTNGVDSTVERVISANVAKIINSIIK